MDSDLVANEELIIPSFAINISPNPSHDFINLSIEGKQVLDELSLFDAQGKLVYRAREYQTSEQIDIGFLEAGTYYLEIKDGKSRGTGQFIKIE